MGILRRRKRNFTFTSYGKKVWPIPYLEWEGLVKKKGEEGILLGRLAWWWVGHGWLGKKGWRFPGGPGIFNLGVVLFKKKHGKQLGERKGGLGLGRFYPKNPKEAKYWDGSFNG